MNNVTQLHNGVGSLEVLERISGLTYKQLDFWTAAGRVKALPGRTGSGNYRRYSEDQVQLIARIHRLLTYGFTLNTAEQLAKSPEKVTDAMRMLTAIHIELFNLE